MMFCQGLHVFAHVETPGAPQLPTPAASGACGEAGTPRPVPRGRHGLQNLLRRIFDDYGQPIVVAGNGQGVYYMLPVMIGRTFSNTRRSDEVGALAGADILETGAAGQRAGGRPPADS
jgi:hypothetical protein